MPDENHHQKPAHIQRKFIFRKFKICIFYKYLSVLLIPKFLMNIFFRWKFNGNAEGHRHGTYCVECKEMVETLK